ncbi:MAG TPA: ClpXP protease specificity-enhancing factor SspB [Thermoanaerobaculia bacterium]|nr:ClpXP protease specificity-enhancing factor SspB [Thermoanaerobaculia bacterium]
MSEGIDYPDLLRRATLGLVREVLTRVEAEGLPGEHHFYLSFATGAPGVEIAPALRGEFPETMTIVLQNQFWELVVEDDAFSVTLRFGGDYQRLKVPWEALTSFLDPSIPFGLDFTQFAVSGAEPGSAAVEAEPPAGAEETAEGGDATGADVLPFRRPPSSEGA